MTSSYDSSQASAAKTSAPVSETISDFTSFGLPEKLMQALNRIQFTKPTPIQAEAIPFALEGRDILGSAQTGTGKTGAFGIPLIAKLMENEFATALVMTPTRELASQVLASLQQMIPVPNLKTALLIGGEAMPRQFRQLQGKPRLIVGTPGRINDHLTRGTVKLNKTQFLVLDETDRMLDMGFGIQIDAILKHIPQDNLQTMLFSATLPPEIIKLSSKYLKNPLRIAVGSTIAPSANIKQELVQTSESDKYQQLLMQVNQRNGSIIIFVKTKHGADRLADKLSRAEHQAEAIHGDLRQSRRDRVIQDFRNRKHRILVATDVAARGLDIPHIEHVINYDLPQVPEDYIHRIGRTARAGAEGEAVNLLTPADNAKWRAIQRLMNPEQRLPAHKGDGEGGERRGNKPSGGRKSFGNGKKPWGAKPFSKSERGERDDSFRKEQRKPWAPNADRSQDRSADRPNDRFSNGRNDRGNDRNDRGDRSSAPRKAFGENRFSGDRANDSFRKDKDTRKPFGENRFSGERKEQGARPEKKWDSNRQDRFSNDRFSNDRSSNHSGDRNDRPAGGERKRTWNSDKPAAFAGKDGQAPAKKKHYGDRMKKREDGGNVAPKRSFKPRAA